MTSLEIQKAKKTLPPRKDWQNWTRKQKRLDEELSCREMIISCMVYCQSGFYNRKNCIYKNLRWFYIIPD